MKDKGLQNSKEIGPYIRGNDFLVDGVHIGLGVIIVVENELWGVVADVSLYCAHGILAELIHEVLVDAWLGVVEKVQVYLVDGAGLLGVLVLGGLWSVGLYGVGLCRGGGGVCVKGIWGGLVLCGG